MQLHSPITVSAGSPSVSEEVAPASAATRARRRRRLRWSAALAGALLLLTLLPPLVNANRYQRQVARSMSESLGRPVHLKNVTLHLLPVPGLTLEDLVVSEDPAFGAEPAIRANTVEATLRLSSLWRRRVEFSTVRFVEPTVNLVRNAQGRWNLADVLLHASHVDTAPTAQRRAGPTPRFPYIEATGGRVDVKFADTKLPFSLTDADFALWLRSANRWEVRLRGQPARTDMNITDPGVARLEGDLERGGSGAGVLVHLRGSWHDAPLGEASKIVSGEDWGWRGTVNVDARLAGTLEDAQVATRLTLGSLRRAEFAPAQPFDLQVSCASGVTVQTVSLTNLLCTMPDSAPTPMRLEAAALDLAHPERAAAQLRAEGIPLHWGLLWAALFSPRVPVDLHPQGTLDLNLAHTAEAAPAVLAPGPEPETATEDSSGWRQWTGVVRMHLPPAPEMSGVAAKAAEADSLGNAADAPLPTELVWRTGDADAAAPGIAAPVGRGPALVLQPVSVPLEANMALNLTGSVTPAGYTLTGVGEATAASLLLPARYLPPLGDGLDAVLPTTSGSQPAPVAIRCERAWGAAQTCTALSTPLPGSPKVPVKPARGRRGSRARR